MTVLLPGGVTHSIAETIERARLRHPEGPAKQAPPGQGNSLNSHSQRQVTVRSAEELNFRDANLVHIFLVLSGESIRYHERDRLRGAG